MRSLARTCRTAMLLAVAPALVGVGGTVAPASAATAWLCRPGLAANPCAPGSSTTLISPSGQPRSVVTAQRLVTKPKVDCFYVYPTVSDQKTPQATLAADPEIRSIARYQAAAYGHACATYAPLYRQITIAGLLAPNTVTDAMRTSAYTDVRSAFHDFLKTSSKGRGFVLIGQSQGSFILRRLIKDEVDAKAALRRRLVSAILLGGNVLVREDEGIGGDFQHVPACRKARQLRCVVAFSTFTQTPPANALVGWPRPSFSGLDPIPPSGTAVLCTNPAALAGGSAALDTIYPAAPFAPGTIVGGLVAATGFPAPTVTTPWIEARGAYAGACASAQGATVLLIRPRAGAPVLSPLPDAAWGVHLIDANIALGDLVRLVRGQVQAYLKKR